MGLTPILTAEGSPGEGATDLDAYLADTVIRVDYQPGGSGRPPRREISVVKTRGHSHTGGAHPFEIGPDGIRVYPHRYAEKEIEMPAAGAVGLLSTGAPGLDSLLGGGYTPGSCILVAGLSGTFKTTLAGHFLMSGAARGEKGLWITFQERAAELERAFAAKGMDLNDAAKRGLLAIDERIPGREPVEKILQDAESRIAADGACRVVIDGMSDLITGLQEEGARQEATLLFLNQMRARGVTTLYTQRLSRAPGRNPLSEIEWPELADTIVFLGMVEIESRLEKVVSVLKHRGAVAECDLRSITCGPKGLHVSDRFIGLSGVLGGSAQGQRKAQIENIFQPLYFIRDFLSLAADPTLDPARREQTLKNLSAQTEKVIETLGKHFDLPAGKTEAETASKARRTPTSQS